MSRVVLCDICSKICEGKQYFSLNGWLGKGKHYPAERQKDEAWEIQQIRDIESLSIDVCPNCLKERVGIAHLNPIKTREMLMQEVKARNPRISGLALLRKTAVTAMHSVTCDLCQSDCIDKHIEIKAGWLTLQGEELSIQLCEHCVENRLSPSIQSNYQSVTSP